MNVNNKIPEITTKTIDLSESSTMRSALSALKALMNSWP